MALYDVREVKNAAEGRWKEILINVGGIPAEYLDGNHHPCPKCGGDDRFRLIDEESGAVLCNQCFNQKNGDGIAAVAWSKWKKFNEVLPEIAAYVGVHPKQKKVDPASKLRFMDWNLSVVNFLLSRKDGLTERAILDAGGVLASYQNEAVIAFPVFGMDLETAVGWACIGVHGDLKKFKKVGSKYIETGVAKVKLTYGSGVGLIGRHAVERLRTPGLVKQIWKVEGVTDLIAMSALIPDDQKDETVVVTNSSGANETLGWRAGVLSQAPCWVLHDADRPGQSGAENAAMAIMAAGGNTKNVQLPYDIEPKHGKDVRDYILAGNGYADFQLLADKVPLIEAPSSSSPIEYDSEFPEQDRMLSLLKLDVAGEMDDRRIRVYSSHLKKASWLAPAELARLKMTTLLQIAGSPAKFHATSDSDEQTEDCFLIRDVAEAIALQASDRRHDGEDERGIGVWDAVDGVAVCNKDEVQVYRDGILHPVEGMRHGKNVYQLGSGRKWVDFEQLESDLKAASSSDWRYEVAEQTMEIFQRWRWEHPAQPLLATGLVLASWIQDVWHWRPHVCIVGESNSGKSLLLETLGGEGDGRGFFGMLAFRSAKSTEAGIRQGVGQTSVVAMVDEFESSIHRKGILEMMRAANRGETIARGTSNQSGRTYRMRRIFWTASTESGAIHQADRNRFIELTLLPAETGKENQLRIPGDDLMRRLGQKQLAVALWSAKQAVELAGRLREIESKGSHPRLIESLAVPASMVSMVGNCSYEDGETVLRGFLGSIAQEEADEKEHDQLLHDVLAAGVHCGNRDGVLSVGQVIDNHTLRAEHSEKLEAKGVRFYRDTEQLFIATRMVRSGLLKGTEWQDKRLDQILKRIEGAEKTKRRVAGHPVNGYLVPCSGTGSRGEIDVDPFVERT